MHAMQYRITLPADYDMKIIRRRVESRGHLLDDFPGLGLKAYLIRERGTGGTSQPEVGGESPVNQYAPFYLWNTPQGMNSFLWGPGFQGIIDDFGRPEVEHWTGLAFEHGPAAGRVPRAAARRAVPIPPGEDPAAVIDRAAGAVREYAGTPGVHSAALAVDPRHWELLHFTLWEHTAPAAAGDRYEVLHLSAPERNTIETGRQW
ncbi:DUF4865 family protein [Streptomyces sp. SID13666]|uniref:DUF4865 family protein n=1 Tax=unclassified Streptomyces TaxID=2593676 RepID=UPI0013C1E9E2|nr:MULTISPECIES: DUF4865 family protein [unclassified Streptomyces]NEA57223.1 DUF4865 family protein [Streptomyces sp. SID13666]NEA74317.1 DUF4865 family protein [Streptomyces sp. SID13588]